MIIFKVLKLQSLTMSILLNLSNSENFSSIASINNTDYSWHAVREHNFLESIFTFNNNIDLAFQENSFLMQQTVATSFWFISPLKHPELSISTSVWRTNSSNSDLQISLTQTLVILQEGFKRRIQNAAKDLRLSIFQK